MDFQSKKSFGKLRLRAFQPYHQTLCILKHVEDVEDNLQHLWHASTYIRFDGMVGKPQALRCIWSIFDIFDIALIFCTVFNAFNAMYLNTSNIKQCALTHIDTHPLMYTQQIRWQWVTMGVNEWLPHYLIWSRSHCNSNFNSKWVVVRRNNPK